MNYVWPLIIGFVLGCLFMVCLAIWGYPMQSAPTTIWNSDELTRFNPARDGQGEQ